MKQQIYNFVYAIEYSICEIKSDWTYSVLSYFA